MLRGRAVLIAVLVASALLGSTILSAHAQQNDSEPSTPQALADVYACAEQNDTTARLACYDAAVGRLRQAESQGQMVAIDRERSAQVRRESFGFNLPSFSRLFARRQGSGEVVEEDVRQVEMQVERIVPRAHGRYAFIMTNGQTWAQVEPQRPYNVRAGDTIRVERAAIGSFLLVSPRGGAGHRVRREE